MDSALFQRAIFFAKANQPRLCLLTSEYQMHDAVNMLAILTSAWAPETGIFLLPDIVVSNHQNHWRAVQDTAACKEPL